MGRGRECGQDHLPFLAAPPVCVSSNLSSSFFILDFHPLPDPLTLILSGFPHLLSLLDLLSLTPSPSAFIIPSSFIIPSP